MEILINNRQEIVEINKHHRQAIKEAIAKCIEVEELNDNLEISISFVTNEEIKQLNRDYRNIDKVTDVLSFPMDEITPTEEIIILGDIIISMEKIIEQAQDFNHSIERELIYLVVHSMLHLLGYDHIEENDKIEMRTKEKEIMKKLKLYK